VIDEAAVPVLTPEDLAAVEAVGTRRSVAPGEYLYRAGDATYDFYVVVRGSVVILTQADGGEREIARHGAGRFLGELNLLSGMRVFVSARVVEGGEVLVVPHERLLALIATNPPLSDKVLAAFIARRKILLEGAAHSVRVVGSRFSPGSLKIREFLSRLRIPHQWLDAEDDADVDALLESFGVGPADLPVVATPTAVLRHPTPGELADYLGLTVDRLPEMCFDLVVVGGGPGGLAAAVYGASEGLATLALDARAPGGQAATSSRIENYLGFPLGISGGELAQRALVQAEKFGAVLSTPCEAVSLHEEAGHLVVRLSNGDDVVARAAIAASGASYRKLDVARLEEFEGNGVYYAATEMEARSCVPKPVTVAGGGNSAGQAAMFLADAGSPVTVVVRAEDVGARMSRYLVDRIAAHPRVTVRTGTQVAGLEGSCALEAVRLAGSGGEDTIECSALFSFIGAVPASGWISGCATLDPAGFVVTDRALNPDALDDRWAAQGRSPLPFETSHPGLFAVGDLRSGSTKRVAAAVGEGSACVSSVHQYLSFSHAGSS
jgi:thioredoxin reductase (NADPH)